MCSTLAAHLITRRESLAAIYVAWVRFYVCAPHPLCERVRHKIYKVALRVQPAALSCVLRRLCVQGPHHEGWIITNLLLASLLREFDARVYKSQRCPVQCKREFVNAERSQLFHNTSAHYRAAKSWAGSNGEESRTNILCTICPGKTFANGHTNNALMLEREYIIHCAWRN